MKKVYQYLLVMLLWPVVFAGYSFSEEMYVSGITEITLRTGPSVENKIVAMLKTGTKLDIIDYQKDWSEVRTGSGKTGYVLTRLLTRTPPDARLVEELKEKNQNLMATLATLEEENKSLTVRNAALVEIEEKYNRLQEESADFLKLDAKYTEMVQQSEAQKIQIQKLEANMDKEPKIWFLIGPGVFIVGLVFGLSTRKKKRSSLL